jgi:sulfoxide reductase catalytic subunit YedY
MKLNKMTRRIFTDPTIDPRQVTPKSIFINRRQLLFALSAGVAGAPAGGQCVEGPSAILKYSQTSHQELESVKTPYEAVTGYNNFYEFGTDKTDPARYAHSMVTDPWEVRVGGLIKRPGSLSLDDLFKEFDLEERIYRFRCVEGWSMVVPWIGFPLSDLLGRFEPRPEGRFVEFKTLYRPSEMRGTRSFTSTINWPYREGLRLDEAMHPLTFLAVGLYGETLPKQNGAPVRLVVPWKYGFKSIKSLVEINIVSTQPTTTWQSLQPREYGFYANVNPEVDHPRWSQSYERRLPSSIFSPNRVRTLPFNGYGDQVAYLYQGMDLRRDY